MRLHNSLLEPSLGTRRIILSQNYVEEVYENDETTTYPFGPVEWVEGYPPEPDGSGGLMTTTCSNSTPSTTYSPVYYGYLVPDVTSTPHAARFCP